MNNYPRHDRPEVGRSFTLDAYAEPVRLTRSGIPDLRPQPSARAPTPTAVLPPAAAAPPPLALAAPAGTRATAPPPRAPLTLALIESGPADFAAVLNDAVKRRQLAAVLWNIDPASRAGCVDVGDLDGVLLTIAHPRGGKVVQRIHVRPGSRAPAL